MASVLVAINLLLPNQGAIISSLMNYEVSASARPDTSSSANQHLSAAAAALYSDRRRTVPAHVNGQPRLLCLDAIVMENLIVFFYNQLIWVGMFLNTKRCLAFMERYGKIGANPVLRLKSSGKKVLSPSQNKYY